MMIAFLIIFYRFWLHFGSQLGVHGPQEGPKKRPGCVLQIGGRTHFLGRGGQKAPKSMFDRFLIDFGLIFHECSVIC